MTDQSNGAGTIPQPDEKNPAPQVGDVWFNYRSMQEVRVVRIDKDRISMVGARSGKTSTTGATDVAKPKWFKFLRHEEAPTQILPRDIDDEHLELLREMLAEQRRTNGSLEKLLALWVAK